MPGFQMTPNGIVPIEDPPGLTSTVHAASTSETRDDEDDDVVLPGNAAFARSAPAPAQKRATPAARPAQPTKPKPKDIVKLARARLREVGREIARIEKLKRERDELQRLVDAAENKPLAEVRGLNTVKRGA